MFQSKCGFKNIKMLFQEEEFAGTPVMCQLPKSKHWTLVAVVIFE
jgi:hypothetical protein